MMFALIKVRDYGSEQAAWEQAKESVKMAVACGYPEACIIPIRGRNGNTIMYRINTTWG